MQFFLEFYLPLVPTQQKSSADFPSSNNLGQVCQYAVVQFEKDLKNIIIRDFFKILEKFVRLKYNSQSSTVMTLLRKGAWDRDPELKLPTMKETSKGPKIVCPLFSLNSCDVMRLFIRYPSDEQNLHALLFVSSSNLNKMLSVISKQTVQKSIHYGRVISNGLSSAALKKSITNIQNESLFRLHFFSTAIAPMVETNIPDVLKYEAEVVRRVKSHLLEIDTSKKGQIDAETLKTILRKVGGFSDKEVLELGELFYAARGGAAATHEDFLRGVAQVIREKDKIGTPYVDEKVASEESNAVVHRRIQKINHPLGLGSCSVEYMFGKQRGVYSEEELDIKLTHVTPKTMVDRAAFASVKVVRFLFDAVSLWNVGEITQAKVMRRVIFLETVAAIPGFVAAMVRHFRSLRNMTRDGGMLNMFLDEANNERMHLLTFVKMRDPSIAFRVMVMVSQTLVGTGFFVLYHLSPAFCHRFVGYIEEEACSTYTKIIKTIEEAPEGSEMAQWRTQLAPAIGRAYWHLGGNGTVLDLMYAIRADEAEHRDVNHTCSGFKEGQMNPLYNPQEKFDQMLLKYVKQMMERSNRDMIN